MSIEADTSAISKATAGPDQPRAIKISRPTTVALWCQVGSLAAAVAITAVIIWIIGFMPWPKVEAVALKRIFFLGCMGLAALGCVGLSALSQFFSKVDAQAGPGHIIVSNGDPQP